MNEAGQIGREEIALGAGATRTDLPALGARFLLDPATVTRLGEPRTPGVDRDDGPASTHSQTGQSLDKHARRTEVDRLPVGLLPRPIGELLQVKGAAQPQHPMGQLPVAALARGGQLPVQLAPPGLHLPLAFGHLPALRAPLDPAPLVVVGRVVGPPLPVELPIQPPQRFGVGATSGQNACSSAACRETTAMVEGPRSSPTTPLPSWCGASGRASPGTPTGQRSGYAPRACGAPGART